MPQTMSGDDATHHEDHGGTEAQYKQRSGKEGRKYKENIEK